MRSIQVVRWFAALVVVALLTACGSAQSQAPAASSVVYVASAQPADFVVYRDPQYPFQLQVPRDWYLGQLSSPTYGIVLTSNNDPKQPRAAMSVLVEPTNGTIDLAQVVTNAEQTLRAQAGIADWKLNVSRPALVNGVTAQEQLYTYTLDGQAVQQRIMYVGGKQQLYAISLLAPPALYVQDDALFSTVLASFQGS